jgi:plasmid stability protein
MADILIRGLDAKTIKGLKSRARRNGRSLQGEAKLILERSAQYSVAEALSAAKRVRRSLGRRFNDSAELIRKDRER